MSSRFRKLGLVYNAAGHQRSWAANSALTPTPMLHPDGHIRVFAGFRDAQGISRIGYVDLDSGDPTRVLGVSAEPVLDVGRNGCFDDNGVILGDLCWRDGDLFLFYVGFQKVQKAKFLAFTGVAVSKDGGQRFTRLSEAPIVDRGPGQTTIGAVHTAWHENGQWRLWYARGDDWQRIGGADYPRYDICYLSGEDLLDLPRGGQLCIAADAPEYRIGRPRVYRHGASYLMYYTKGTLSGEYFPGRARSADGVHWTREDGAFELALSPGGWDSRHLCYPSFLTVGAKEYLFYNGNDMGRDGFGVAVRESLRGV
jgi:hypothetical protein